MFNITNACTPQPYTVSLLAFNTPCFTVSLLDFTGKVITPTFPALVIQTTNLATLIIRQPPAACPFETVRVTFQQGTTANCQGFLTALTSMNMATPAPVATTMQINAQQYHFFQIANINQQIPYVVSMESNPTVIDTLDAFNGNGEYATQFNCNDKIAAKTPVGTNFPAFSVLQPALGSNFLSLGLFSANVATYNLHSYQAIKTPLNLGVPSGAATILANEHQWFTIPTPSPLLAVTLMGTFTGLSVVFPPMNNLQNPFPSQFDNTPIILTPNVAMTVQTPSAVFAVLNTGNAPQTYSVKVAMLPPTAPAAPTVLPVVLPNQAVLALSLGAIIGIIIGALAFISLIIVGVCVYSKSRSRRAREYRPVSQVAVKKEPSTSSTTTESSSETESREDDDYDSYPPPRQANRGSRIYRSGGQDRSRSGRSRNRDYSDDDSSDYS